MSSTTTPTHRVKEAAIMLGAAHFMLSEARSDRAIADVKDEVLELISEAEESLTSWMKDRGFDLTGTPPDALKGVI